MKNTFVRSCLVAIAALVCFTWAWPAYCDDESKAPALPGIEDLLNPSRPSEKILEDFKRPGPSNKQKPAPVRPVPTKNKGKGSKEHGLLV
ncbi:MAG: hypothetical protein ACOYXY_01055 [Thermodesulfobacteriota bacterium]